MTFTTPKQISEQMVKAAVFLTKGKVDPFDHCPVVEPRFYFEPRNDVTVRNAAQVVAEIRNVCKNPAKVTAAVEAVAHFAMPRATHMERDAFKKTF